jgi:hypothetical protein
MDMYDCSSYNNIGSSLNIVQRTGIGKSISPPGPPTGTIPRSGDRWAHELPEASLVHEHVERSDAGILTSSAFLACDIKSPNFGCTGPFVKVGYFPADPSN